ncbi:unnamed protein product [Peniophora sp. CBMAI 1063]|nr:unnamed protein product [Peniophora sp. CBMAI 1063]
MECAHRDVAIRPRDGLHPTKRSEGDDLDSYRAKLLQEIERLQGSLALALDLYNSKAPLLSLPDELLVEIFLYVRDSAPLVESEFDLQNLPTPWYTSVTVCRRLRRVVLSSAALHTRLSTLTHSYASIKRGFLLSKSLPVTLEVHYPSRNTRLFDLLVRHGHRVHTLHVRGSPDCSKVLSDWLSRLPSLRSLHLFRRTLPPDFLFLLEDPLSAPSKLSPHLSIFKLNGVGMVPVSGYKILCNVTELSISNTMLSILILSQHAKSLSKLSMTNVRCVPGVIDETITLPSSLQVLECTGVRAEHFDLLSFVTPSAHIRLKLSCTAPPKYSYEARGKCETILTRWTNETLAPSAAELRVSDNTIALDVHLSFHRHFDDTETARGAADIEYHFYADEHDTLLHNIIPCLPSPSYERLVSLTLSAEMDTYSNLVEHWLKTHSISRHPMPCLRHLCIDTPVNFASDSDSEAQMFFNMMELRGWLAKRLSARRGVQTLSIPAHSAVMLDGFPLDLDVPTDAMLDTWLPWRTYVQDVIITEDDRPLLH